jgi:hypothetical protein
MISQPLAPLNGDTSQWWTQCIIFHETVQIIRLFLEIFILKQYQAWVAPGLTPCSI